MKLKNKVNGSIITVSDEHAQNVLLPQGQFYVFKEPVVEDVPKPVAKKKTKKKSTKKKQ